MSRKNFFPGQCAETPAACESHSEGCLSERLYAPTARSSAAIPFTNLKATMKYSVDAYAWALAQGPKQPYFFYRRSSAGFLRQQKVPKFQKFLPVPAVHRRDGEWLPCLAIPVFRRAYRNQSSRKTACRLRPGGRSGGGRLPRSRRRKRSSMDATYPKLHGLFSPAPGLHFSEAGKSPALIGATRGMKFHHC